MIKITLFLLSIFDKIYQKKIIKIFKDIFNDKINILFDVGAHKGETIKLFMKNFKIDKIYSFEPSPYNFNDLKKNLNKIELNKTSINIYNLALGEKEEIKKFKQMKEGSSSTLSKININSNYFKRKNFFLNLGLDSKPFNEIDVKVKDGFSFVKNQNINFIDLLKIDTEGHEYFVLKGFGNYIANIKVIFFEHHYDKMVIKNYNFKDIHNYLINHQFKKYAKFKMPFRKSFEYIYINKNL